MALVFRPGEKLPLDGEVISGRSDINQAPITGKRLPVSAELGSAVFARTISGDADRIVPVRHSGLIYPARPEIIDLLVFPDADHWSHMKSSSTRSASLPSAGSNPA